MHKSAIFASVLFFVATAVVTAIGFYISPTFILAQTQTATPQQVAEREARLRAELEQTEREIAEWRSVLTKKQAETASLARDAAILNAKIEEAKLVIKARNLNIERLGKDIGEKQKTITTLESKIERSKEAISELIRRSNEIDSYSAVEIALSNKDLSEFFVDLDSYISINKSLNEMLEDVRATKNQNEEEKQVLSKKQIEEADAKAAIEAEKRQVERNEAEKKRLININKTQEKTYSQVIAEREKKAAQIRSALFSLRDTAAIPFGEALKYANEASAKTGVRPAFLLAILTQESNLGENVGQCLMSDFTTGDGFGKNTGKFFKAVMKPTRDIAPFLDLANRLGFDPKMKPVSCPIAGVGGYGGAMGPSQFIPSTWAGYEKKIAAALGVAIPDPWIPRDAFMASALYLADLGAGAGGHTAESTAAAKYYAGSGWKTRGQSYARSVMGHAANIQENMINPLLEL